MDLQPAVEPTWGGLGYNMVQNRGVQNVPLMATVGVQYQNGTASVPTGTVPVPSFYQPVQPAATNTADQESELPIWTSGGTEGPSFYQPCSQHGPQMVTIPGLPTVPAVPSLEGMVGGARPPVIVTGSACALCGRGDHHLHRDAGVVSSANNAAANDGIVTRVDAIPGQTTLLTRSVSSVVILQ